MKQNREPIVHYDARRLNQLERKSGYRFPGKIVAAVEWINKKKGSIEAATSQEPTKRKSEKKTRKKYSSNGRKRQGGR